MPNVYGQGTGFAADAVHLAFKYITVKVELTNEFISKSYFRVRAYSGVWTEQLGLTFVLL